MNRPPERTVVLLVLALIMASVCGSAGVPAASPEFSPTPPCAPGDTFLELAPIGAWSWYGDPKAITYVGEHARTYAGWVDDGGSIVVASYDHETGEIISTVIRDSLERDDHDNPSLLIEPDGRITAFFAPHGGVGGPKTLRRLYYTVTENREDVSSWQTETELETNTGGKWGFTYPNACRLAGEGGRTYLFWRGGDGRPTVSFSDDMVEWNRAEALIWSNGERPYLKIASDGDEIIHLGFTDGHPRGEPTNSIYYAYYHQGTFHRIDGTEITSMTELRTDPIFPKDATIVHDARADSIPAWIWDIAVDSDGYPVIAYVNFPETTDHRYRYARWDGRSWLDTELCPAGGWTVDFSPARKPLHRFELWYSGGITLDHEDPSVVYLSRPVDGIFEIERWVTPDGGRTWTSEPVTCGSRKDNTRPCVPRGHEPGGPDVIWMYGDYIHYRDYETSMRMRVEPKH